jgi:hypothetical protein
LGLGFQHMKGWSTQTFSPQQCLSF